MSAAAEPEASPLSVAAPAAPPEPTPLSDAELDAVEEDLTRAERTLGLLADDDIDPAAAADWLAEP